MLNYKKIECKLKTKLMSWFSSDLFLSLVGLKGEDLIDRLIVLPLHGGSVDCLDPKKQKKKTWQGLTKVLIQGFKADWHLDSWQWVNDTSLADTFQRENEMKLLTVQKAK